MLELGRIPQATVEYLERGSREGSRNASLLAASCQLRDAKWPIPYAEDVLTRRGRLDGLNEGEISATLRSVFASAPRESIGDRAPSTFGMPIRQSKFMAPEREEGIEPIVYALDEADDLPEPIDDSPTVNFLETLFRPTDKIQIVVGKKNDSGGESPTGAMPILTRDDWVKKLKEKGNTDDLFSARNEDGKIFQGLYVSINPLREVKDGRKKKNIARYEHALIEFDTISIKQQWQLIKKSRVPCATVCFSGNKSIHALVRVNARDAEQYSERVGELLFHFKEYEVDIQNKDPSRLSRLPGCTRGDTLKKQTLLAVNMGCRSWDEWKDHAADKFPSIMTQEEFYAEELSEPPVIIEGLLHRQLSMVIGGSSKTYKSWTLLDMAISTANGIPFWGFNTKPGKCLYINFEIPEYYMRERIKAICDAKKIDLPSDNLYVWNLRGRAQALENIRPKFTKVMANANFAMVILDPIYKTLGNRDENAAGDINSLMNEMEHLALETGAAVVFATHFSKGNQASKNPIDRISGSGVFARSPDTILTLTEHEEDGCYTVDSTVRNFGTPEPFVVKMDFPLFRRTKELDPKKLKRAGGRPQAEDCIPDILDTLRGGKKGDWLQNDLIDKMIEMGHNTSTVKRQISKAVKDGRLDRQSSPGKPSRIKKSDEITIIAE